MHGQAASTTYLKLTGAMFMWGGTWIAGRIIAQELSAPLAAPAIRFLLAGLVLAGVALLGDRLTAAGLLGIALVSGGILLIVLGRSIAVAGLIAAGIAGLLTTAYIGRRWRCS